MKKQNAVAILRIVLPYVVFAGLWILLSDRLLLQAQLIQAQRMESVTGWPAV